MVTHFIGRKRELAILEKAYSSEQNEFYPIYGRRRIGKSELIKEFIKDKPGVYYLGKKATAELQMREFLSSAGSQLNIPILEKLQRDDWKTLLDQILKMDMPERWVLVLDEFQWMAEVSPEFPSLLQGYIDEKWGGRSKVMLILCGSYMGFMEREVLGEKSPLFGRRTGQIHLKPFQYHEAALFHPSWSREDQAKAYFICGGIPYYLNFMREDRSIAVNIIDNFIDDMSALAKEPDFLLKEELRELEKYNSLLIVLSKGSHQLQMISRETGIQTNKLPYYLNHLIQLGYVKKRYPLSSSKTSPRTVRYKLDDPLLKFWFRFIFPNQSYIEIQKPETVYQQIIEPFLPAYFGECFESLCREALPKLLIQERAQGKFEVGEYWDKTVQIDALGIRSDGRIELCECKWGKAQSTQLHKELLEKKERFPNPENHTISLRAFTNKKCERQTPEIVFHELKDLYELP